MGQWAPEYTGRLEFTPLREVDGEYYAFQAVGDRIQLVTLNEAGFPEKTAVSFPLPEQAGSTVDLDWDEELLAVMDQEAHTA